jgi:hypothetical protein
MPRGPRIKLAAITRRFVRRQPGVQFFVEESVLLRHRYIGVG